MIRILLVDDHALFRSGLRSRLEAERDIEIVGEAGTAAEGVIKARALQPDVILLDLLMPRRNGFEAIPEIARVAPDARVLTVSSQASPSAVRTAVSAGAVGYVTKRSSDPDLIAAIRRVAAGERYVDPALGASLIVADDQPELDPLSERERDVLHLLALGYTNQEIGKRLFISVRTVDTHRAHIMQKLRMETRAELVLFALANGLIGAAA